MNDYKILKIKEHPELAGKVAEWFHQKWHIPKEAYAESMRECIEGRFGCSKVVCYFGW